MVQIRQYEQQLAPNSAMLPTVDRAPGEVIGSAISQLGKAGAGFSADMMRVQDRNAKLEATRILSDAELQVTQQLMTASDSLGADKNPEGFAGEFNKVMETMKEKTLSGVDQEKANPYLSQHLTTGFGELQRRTFLQSLKVEREAAGKYQAKVTGEVVGTFAKQAALEPERFGELVAKASEAINNVPGRSAEMKAEGIAKAGEMIAGAAIGSIIDTDSKRAVEILADADNPMVKALSPQAYLQAKDSARKEYVTDQGKAIGDGIGLNAGSWSDVSSRVAKIKDPDIRAQAEQAARQTYAQRLQADAEYKDKAEKDWYQQTRDNPGVDVPFPASMDMSARNQAMAVKASYAYQMAGGGVKDNMDVYLRLYDMSQNDPIAFAKEDLNKSMAGLSSGSFMLFQKKQIDTQNGRTSQSSVIADAQMKVAAEQVFPKNKSGTYKESRFALTKAVTAQINQLETEQKAPANAEQIRKIINEYTRFNRVEPQSTFLGVPVPLTGGDQTKYGDIPGAYGGLISDVLVKAGRPVTPGNVADVYGAIVENRPEIEDYLISQNMQVTEENMIYGLMSLANKAK